MTVQAIAPVPPEVPVMLTTSWAVPPGRSEADEVVVTIKSSLIIAVSLGRPGSIVTEGLAEVAGSTSP